MYFVRKIAFIFLFFSFSILSSGIQGYSLPEALKVLEAIEKIKSERSSGNKSSFKKIIISESEFNSYIAYRIETEKEEIMKELRLKLFKGNWIEGKILIDLRGQKIPKFLSPQMTFFFGLKLEVENERVRLDKKVLFLENKRVPLKIIEFVIYTAAKIKKTKAWSINDWYELPYGIKDIEIHHRKAIFFY